MIKTKLYPWLRYWQDSHSSQKCNWNVATLNHLISNSYLLLNAKCCFVDVKHLLKEQFLISKRKLKWANARSSSYNTGQLVTGSDAWIFRPWNTYWSKSCHSILRGTANTITFISICTFLVNKFIPDLKCGKQQNFLLDSKSAKLSA